jgi:hypothetical protein
VAVGHGIERPGEQGNARHGGGLARARPRRKAGCELVIRGGGKNWRRAGTRAIHLGLPNDARIGVSIRVAMSRRPVRHVVGAASDDFKCSAVAPTLGPYVVRSDPTIFPPDFPPNSSLRGGKWQD